MMIFFLRLAPLPPMKRPKAAMTTPEIKPEHGDQAIAMFKVFRR